MAHGRTVDIVLRTKITWELTAKRVVENVDCCKRAVRRGHCDFRFCGLDIFLIGFSVFVSKDVGFSVLVFNAVCGFFVF